ncbi:MAG: methionine ABC transporter permease [Gammaproteobacteria bacterium]
MSAELLHELSMATIETIYMTLVSGFFATVFGLPLGILLLITDQNHIMPHKKLNMILGMFVNILRSIPFIILLVAIIPFTRFIVGTSIGTTAAIVPLSLGAMPFIARMVESSMAEISHSLIETGIAMGASVWQIITKILLPESLASLVSGLTIVLISLIGYSAMAGAVGGGGLGDFAIRYGYQQFNTVLMLETVVILIVVVQLMQWLGDWLVRRLKK